jgi:hypothetical protein
VSIALKIDRKILIVAQELGMLDSRPELKQPAKIVSISPGFSYFPVNNADRIQKIQYGLNGRYRHV